MKINHFGKTCALGLLLLLGTLSAMGDEKERTFEQLKKVMELKDKEWSGKKNYGKLQREFVAIWSQTEIETAGKEIPFIFNDHWSVAILKRWGNID